MNKWIILFLFLCVSIGVETLASSCHKGAIAKVVEASYPTARVLQKSDYVGDSLEELKSLGDAEEPGCVCEKIDGINEFCGVLLTGKKKKDDFGTGLYLIDIRSKKIKEVLHLKGEHRPFIQVKKKAIIENRSEMGLDKVSMPNNGIEYIYPGKSAFVIFYENGKLQQIWTAD